MIVEHKVNSKTILKVEGKTTKDVFEALAEAEEIFGVESCGACQCKEVRHVVRQKDKFVFYEIACQNPQCRAKLGLGQTKEGKLFPQRKTKEGEWKSSGGWERWEGRKDNAQDSVSSAPTQGSRHSHYEDPF